MSNASTDLVPTRVAAEMLDISVFQVARLVQRGELQAAVQAPGKRGARFFLREDIDALVARYAAERQASIALERLGGPR